MEERLIECRLKRDSFMQGLIEEQRRALESDCCGERKRNTIQVLLSLQETEPEYYTDDIIKGLLLITRCRNTTIFRDHQKNAWLEGSASHVALCYLLTCGPYKMTLKSGWDPGKFKPERFDGLEGASDGLKLMPSGYGRRSCL
ncbi:hypothetical protein OIU77_025244 [Salix suchowensis]|uniref:Uncharacterized protein n=1 Tax=Salix suchowensis TaxID=1278906 RepID=A0ABQ9BYG0_9ROSI|nr:hypothetical protein OIU77_025244 [Salix suchowensis]